MIEFSEDPGSSTTKETLEELFESLSFLIGRVIRVETRYQRQLGELKWLNYASGDRLLQLNLGNPSAKPLVSLSLSKRVLVLTDGRWELIHEPNGWQD